MVPMQGLRFGRLVVLERAAGPSVGKIRWDCVCDCGAKTSVCGGHLRRGRTRSCGCLSIELTAATGRKCRRHGLAHTTTWNVWASMRSRCEKPKHKSWRHYGGRGIKVCARWQSFDDFLADMGIAPAGLSIERIDTNGDYEPGNCRWATATEQARNRRSNVHLTAFGETKILCEWTEDSRCMVSTAALQKRISAGWPHDLAISTEKYASRGKGQAL